MLRSQRRGLRPRQIQQAYRCLIALGVVGWITLSSLVVQSAPPPATPPANRSAETSLSVPLEEVAPLKLPPIAQAPIKVEISLYVSNLADVNQASESFEMAGILVYRWRDPRLAYPAPANSSKRKTVTLDQIWHPDISIVNFKESELEETTVEIAADGTVIAQERFAKTLSAAFELQAFPFDRQSLALVFAASRYDEKTVQLVADLTRSSIGTDKFVSLSEWQIGAITSSNDSLVSPSDKRRHSQAILQIQLTRNSGFYVFKFMVPLLLITIASWVVFWIDPREFSTQIQISFTNLLTIIALLLVINESLPKLGYLTLMDQFMMLCFMTILIAILELVVIHRLEAHSKLEYAQKIHSLARWTVPLGFVVSNTILFAGVAFSRT